jgi:hypothetical protein
MAHEGFPFGYLVFSDFSYFTTFLSCFKNLKYDIEANDFFIYIYDSKEFYEMMEICCGYVKAYVISQIDGVGAKYHSM